MRPSIKPSKMLFNIITGLVALTVAPSYAALGTPFEGWGFVQNDWQVVCDNTLTCRAAGYSDEGSSSLPAAVLLTARPKMALPTADIQLFLDDIKEPTAAVELWLNGKSFGKLDDQNDSPYRLSPKQTKALLNHARLTTTIELRSSAKRWSISDKGMSAVLLKLDEVQGRIGTPLALIGQNRSKRQTPKSAKAKPVIKTAPVYAADNQTSLTPNRRAYFQKNIVNWISRNNGQLFGIKEQMKDCKLINFDSDGYQVTGDNDVATIGWQFEALDNKYSLASHLCWRGAYNESYGYWLIDHRNPSQPKLITTAATDYSDGVIQANHKDRGIGDCWNSQAWVWNGIDFVKSEQLTTGLCRGFAGGAWELPTYVSQVIEAPAKLAK